MDMKWNEMTMMKTLQTQRGLFFSEKLGDDDENYEGDDDGFLDYVESTIDPGYNILIFTTIFCICTQLMLPCLVVLGRRWEKRRANRSAAHANAYHDDDDELSVDDFENDEKDKEQATNRYNHAKGVSGKGDIPVSSIEMGSRRGGNDDGSTSFSVRFEKPSSPTEAEVANNKREQLMQWNRDNHGPRNEHSDAYGDGNASNARKSVYTFDHFDDEESATRSQGIVHRQKRERNALPSPVSLSSQQIEPPSGTDITTATTATDGNNNTYTLQNLVDMIMSTSKPNNSENHTETIRATNQTALHRANYDKFNSYHHNDDAISISAASNISRKSHTSKASKASLASAANVSVISSAASTVVSIVDVGIGGRRRRKANIRRYARAARGAAEEERAENATHPQKAFPPPPDQPWASPPSSYPIADDVSAISNVTGGGGGNGSNYRPHREHNLNFAIPVKELDRDRARTAASTPFDTDGASTVSYQPSALSKLDDEAISPGDAADAMDKGVDCTFQHQKLQIQNGKCDGTTHKYGANTNPSEQDMEIDLCCGERAWWRPAMLAHAWDALLDLATYDNESKRILRLSIPFSVSAITETVSENVVVALIAHFIGTEAVAVYAVVDVLLSTTSELLQGIVDSESTLCAHAFGAGNNELAGQYVQLSCFLYFTFQIPCMLVWSFYTKDVLLWFGFNESAAVLGQEFARIANFAILIDGIYVGYEALLEVIEREVYSTIIDVSKSLTWVAATALILVVFDGSLLDVAYVDLICQFIFLGITVIISVCKGWMRPYIGGLFRSFALKNRMAVSQVLKTSLPLSIGSFLASAEWEVLTFFAAKLGPAEVATWAILGSIWDTFEATTEGFGDASEIRVSYHLGKGNPMMAKKSAYKSLLISVVFAILITSIFFIMGDDLPRWFTSDPTLQHMLSELIPLVGIGNITMTFGMVCWALVGSQGRYRLATTIVFVSSWVVTIPVAALSCYVFNIDLQGVTSAVVVGYSTAGTALSYVLLRSDWDKLSKIVQELNAITGEIESSDSDSDDDGSSSSSSSSDSSSDSSDDSSDDDSSDDD